MAQEAAGWLKLTVFAKKGHDIPGPHEYYTVMKVVLYILRGITDL